MSGSTVPNILHTMRTKETPPTYFETNRFTKVFQSIVNAYGVATYREVNPGTHTLGAILQLWDPEKPSSGSVSDSGLRGVGLNTTIPFIKTTHNIDLGIIGQRVLSDRNLNY